MDIIEYAILKQKINDATYDDTEIQNNILGMESDLIELKSDIKNKLNISGYTNDKYLGTDSNGNIIEKDAPSYTGTPIIDDNGVLIFPVDVIPDVDDNGVLII